MEQDLHVVVDRLTGEVVVPLGVWEDPEAAVEEVEVHDPEQPGRYTIRTLLDVDGLTDDTFAQAPHGPSPIPVSPVATLTDGTLLTANFFAKVAAARCQHPVGGTVCGAAILTEESTTTTPTGDVFVPAPVWAGWTADRCATHR